MRKLIIGITLLFTACTTPSMDGVYVIDKEKLKSKITHAKNFVNDRESERILKEIENSRLDLIIHADSAQIISSGQSVSLNDVKYKIGKIKSGIKFTTKDSEITLIKTDSCYLLSVQKTLGVLSLPPDIVEFLKLDQNEANNYLKSLKTVSSESEQRTLNDLSNWTGTYMYPSGHLLIIDVTGNSISGKTEDGQDGNVTFSDDGKVRIDGEEAFLRNDTIFYTLHGAGSSNEIFLVRMMNDMH
ncbi:MAG: hypothetical protein OJF59_001876 [Cytophagales bacterium]|jgi:hypothetical protein|nr:MAG: hypothetical protein OJF59_001876 [Cytophagales bacterium]